jgi:putative hydrolase of the HAD superfamily
LRVNWTDTPQVLIFDADDTLWENNVLFERVIEDFFDWLAHPTLDRAKVRAVLDDIQAANAVSHGYGAKMLLRSLHDCFDQLGSRTANDTDRQQIDRLTAALMDRTVELVPGVKSTLVDLATRHELLLLTKGDTTEQQDKVDASGLAGCFSHVHIVPEKNTATYHAVVEQHRIDPAMAWMIGNSPKSDIRPARAAGLNAVFIPNENTWALEHDVVDGADDRIIMLEHFAQLLDHF